MACAASGFSVRETAEISAIEDPFAHRSARPSVEVLIEGYRALALIDSGAKISAVSKSAFVKLSNYLAKKGLAVKSIDIPPTFVVSASSHKVLVKQAYFIPFTIYNEQKSWKVLVLDNLSNDFILGQDFLSFYGAKMCCRTHAITWGKPLRKIPSADYCLISIPRTSNRFDALCAYDLCPDISHPVPSPRNNVRAKRERAKKKRDSFLQAIKPFQQKCNAAMSDTACTYALVTRDKVTIPPLSSISVKVDLASISGAPVNLQRKTVGLIEQDAILSNKVDILCLEGIAYATMSRSGPFSYVQLSNLSTEYKFYEPKETVAAFSPLVQGTELYDISVLRAAAVSPVVCKEKLTNEKRKYLEESVQIKAPAEFKSSYAALITEFHDVFAASKDDIGHTDLLTHKIHLKDPNQAPVYKKQFPVPWAHQDFINKKVDDLLRQGIIEESFSPYNSPVFAVRKPHSDDLRMVVDMRLVNEISHCTNFRVRCVQECIDEVSQHHSCIFSTLDISSAFYQIGLEVESRPLTSFTIPGRGSFQFCKLPMGLHGSPASLSRVTNFIVRDLAAVIAYLDDLIAHSKDHATHLELLRQLFLRLRKYGLKLQAKKTVLGADSVVYLGYRISKDGIQPGEEKVEAIKQFPEPRTVRQIRQFCGLANYFRHMIPNFSKKSSQLTKLTQKNSCWKAGPLPPESRDAFVSLRNDLSSFPTLAFPDPKKVFHVFTDGAIGSEREPGGLGAVLCQEDVDGRLRPVAYASRALQDNERNYSAFLIEMSAIVFAIQHWHTYLYGRFFFVHCDHKPIEKLKTVHKKTLNRLQELMLEYNFELKYNPGTNNGPADALSRNPISALGVETDIPLAQAEDPFCEAIMRFLHTGIAPDDPSLRSLVLRHHKNCRVLQDGTLGYMLSRTNFVTRTLVVVPATFQVPLIRAAHCSRFSGHLGIFKTVNRLFMNYWWPGLQEQVTLFIKECVTCQLAKTPPNFKREVLPAQPLPILDTFNERVHIDTIGKMRGAKNPWLLVMTCAFSKYVVAVPIANRDAETQAQAIFEHWICRFGAPRIIVHDGDPAYCGELFQKLCKLLGTRTIQISSYHSQSNAHVEVYNKVFQGILRSMLDSPAEPYEPWLPVVALAYNSSVNQATNSSPFFLLFGCDPNLPQFDGLNVSKYNLDFPAERYLQLERARDVAREQLESSAEKNKKYYDRFAKECAFQLGERCLMHLPRSVCMQGHSKFFKPWHPVVVTRILNHTTYVVRRLEKKTRARREITVHANRLKKFFPITILPGYGHSTTEPGPGNRVGKEAPSFKVVRDSSNVPRDSSNVPIGKHSSYQSSSAIRAPFAASPVLVGNGRPPQAAAAAEQVQLPLQAPVLSRSDSSSSGSSFGSFGSAEASPIAGNAAAAPSQGATSAAAAGQAAAPAAEVRSVLPPVVAHTAAPVVRRPQQQQPATGGQSARPPPAAVQSDPRAGPPAPTRVRSFLGGVSEAVYGPSRSTRSRSSAPPIPPLPARPAEYKKTKKKP